MKINSYCIGLFVFAGCLTSISPVRCAIDTEQATGLIHSLPYASNYDAKTYTVTPLTDSNGLKYISVDVGDRAYRIDQDSGMVNLVISNTDESGRAKAPIAMSELRTICPDLPYDRMYISVEDPNYIEYALKYSNGCYDRNVSYHYQNDASGQVRYISIRNNPIGEFPMPIKMTKDEAISIGIRASNDYHHPVGDGRYESYGHTKVTGVIGPMLDRDISGDVTPVYIIYSRVSGKDDFESMTGTSIRENSSSLTTVVNATNGEVIQYVYSTDIEAKAHGKYVSASKTPIIQLTLNEADLLLHRPCLIQRQTVIIPLSFIQSLAKGHTVAAKAGAKAFSLDGKQLTLDAKVLDRKGVLYLPWQSLNSLPGVKAQFDAKLAKLSITTAAAQSAAAK